MRRIIRILMIAAAALASAVAWSGMPDLVPLHWNWRGEVDRYGSRTVALVLMPMIMLGVWALMRLLPRIDPFRENYAKFAGTYELLIDTVLAMMLVIHVAVLLGAGGAPDSVTLVVRLAIGAVLIVLGNVMPRTRQNWFVGVRTPWTLASPRVWEKTHRLAGYLLVGVGVLVIATIPLAPQVGMPILAGGVGLVAISTVVYSYLEWRKEARSPGRGAQ